LCINLVKDNLRSSALAVLLPFETAVCEPAVQVLLLNVWPLCDIDSVECLVYMLHVALAVRRVQSGSCTSATLPLNEAVRMATSTTVTAGNVC
jgi:hypothetical protein